MIDNNPCIDHTYP